MVRQFFKRGPFVLHKVSIIFEEGVFLERKNQRFFYKKGSENQWKGFFLKQTHMGPACFVKCWYWDIHTSLHLPVIQLLI